MPYRPWRCLIVVSSQVARTVTDWSPSSAKEAANRVGGMDRDLGGFTMQLKQHRPNRTQWVARAWLSSLNDCTTAVL